MTKKAHTIGPVKRPFSRHKDRTVSRRKTKALYVKRHGENGSPSKWGGSKGVYTWESAWGSGISLWWVKEKLWGRAAFGRYDPR